MDADAEWIAGYILTGKRSSITLRNIQKDCPALCKPDQLRDRLLATQTLVMLGWLRPYGTKGKEWVVNPLVHDGRFGRAAQAERERRAKVKENISRDAAARREERSREQPAQTDKMGDRRAA